MDRTALAVALSGVVAGAAGCSGPPSSTYVLDLSHFEHGGPAHFSGESLAFRPDLGARTRTRTLMGEDESFRKVHNRLPCQTPHDQSGDDQLAEFGFGSTDSMAAAVPIRLESLSVEVPSFETNLCYAYRTSDGQWHGHFTPVATIRDEAAMSSRVTFEIGEDDVDIVGVVVDYGDVSAVSFVARPE